MRHADVRLTGGQKLFSSSGAIQEIRFRGIIKRVVRIAQPERIILFDSAASGQYTDNSDFDLLVVKSDANWGE